MPITPTSQTSPAQEHQTTEASKEQAQNPTSATAEALGKQVSADLSAHQKENSVSETGSVSSDEGLFARPLPSVKRGVAPPPILVVPLDKKDKPAQITGSPTEATENELKESPTLTMKRSSTPRSGKSPRSPFPHKKGDDTFETALTKLQLELNPELKKEIEEALGLTTPTKKD